MNYQKLYYDGCNGWMLGEILSREEVEQLYPEDLESRNGDGLLEAADGEVLLVPIN